MTIRSVNIIIPLKNEEKGIKNLIEKLTPVLDRIEKKTNISLITSPLSLSINTSDSFFPFVVQIF